MSQFKQNQLFAISRIFSSSVVKEMAQKGESPLFSRLLQESGIQEVMLKNSRVYDVFETAFSILKSKKNRDEYIYKAALTEKVLLGQHSLNTASMMTEFRAGSSKADCVILNGTAKAYEIKSERDNLSKLKKQVSDYLKVFAVVNVIVGDNHLDEVMNTMPKEIGIQKLSNRHTITTVREAKELPERTCPLAIFDSIQLKEASMILQNLGISAPNVPNTQKYSELKKRFACLNSVDVHREMVVVLKRNRNLKPLAHLLDDLPNSLKAAALTTTFRKRDHQNLLKAINTPTINAINWA